MKTGKKEPDRMEPKCGQGRMMADRGDGPDRADRGNDESGQRMLKTDEVRGGKRLKADRGGLSWDGEVEGGQVGG